VDLLAEAKSILRNRGVTSLVFGQDSDHFFPGCPVAVPTLCSFLMVEGFETSGEHFDLERDLGDFEIEVQLPPNAEVRRLNPNESEELFGFLESEFPGRWKHDVSMKVRVEGIENSVAGLLVDGRIHGFALIQDFSHRKPICGGNWHLDLGEHWGALGPIGIAKNRRGTGLGMAMLVGALHCLKQRSVDRCIIDWTHLADFYGKAGFQVTRTYRNAVLPLSES
jgi:GNAT superfamily N-acetyltransferase